MTTPAVLGWKVERVMNGLAVACLEIQKDFREGRMDFNEMSRGIADMDRWFAEYFEMCEAKRAD